MLVTFRLSNRVLQKHWKNKSNEPSERLKFLRHHGFAIA